MGFALVAASRGYSLVAVHRLLIAVASLVVGQGLQELWLMDLVAPWHMGSSRIRDQTRIYCIGRRIFFFTTEPPGKPGF